MRLAYAIGLIALSASSASAQLVFGTTTTATTNPGAIYYDFTTSTTTTLWNSSTNKKVNGLAYDPGTGKIYSNDAARLNFWNSGNVGTAPTAIAGMYRATDPVNGPFSATGVNDMAWANGNLYGATSFPSTTFNRGIYRINVTPDAGAHCVMTALWTTTSTTASLQGLEYRPDTGLFYATSTVDTTGSGGPFGLGLYSIDALGIGSVTKIADLPNLPSTSTPALCDGLAYGNGMFWLTRQEPAQSRIDIFPYDPALGTYGTTLFFPLTDATQCASGAAWAPGALNTFPTPGAASLLALGGLCSARRRRA